MLNKDVTHSRMRRCGLWENFFPWTCSDGVTVGVCRCVSSAGELRTLRFFFWTVLWSTRKERARYNCLHCHTPTHTHDLGTSSCKPISNRTHTSQSLDSTLFLPLSLSLSLCSPVLLSPSQQTNVEVSGEEDFAKLLQLEEDYVHKICNDIIALKPDLVITEKGVSGNSLWE